MRDYYATLKVVRALCEKEDLQVEFIGEEAVPYTDSRTLFVPTPNPTWSEAQWVDWMDGVYHETGHNMAENRDAFELVISNKIDMRTLYGKTLNIVDDFRVDRNRCAKYFGMLEACEAAMPLLVKKQADMPYPFGKGKTEDENIAMEIIWTMKAYDTFCRGLDSPALRGMDALFMPHCTEKMQGWFDKLVSEYTEKYISNETAIEEHEMLQDIYANVFEFESNDENKNPESEDEGEEGTEGGEGGEQSDKEGDKSGDGKSKDKGDKGEGKSGAGSIVVDYDEMLRHPTSKDGIGGGGEVKIVYAKGRKRGHYQPHTDTTSRIVDFSAGDKQSSSRMYPFADLSGINAKLSQMNVNQITAQARRLLQTETRKRPHFNQKKGRLDTSKIYRVTMGGGTSERIFKTKDVSKALDTSVTLLVDYSGSMIGEEKIQVAISGAVAFANLLTTLRVNTEVMGFTESYIDDKNVSYVFKPFGKVVQQDTLIEYMCEGTKDMSNNADGDSLLVAYSRIVRQKTARKIIIVLSDGSPAATRGDIYGFTQEVIKNIEEKSPVEILGIGIMDDNVEALYKHHKVVYTLDKLPEVLIQTLESVILEK